MIRHICGYKVANSTGAYIAMMVEQKTLITRMHRQRISRWMCGQAGKPLREQFLRLILQNNYFSIMIDSICKFQQTRISELTIKTIIRWQDNIVKASVASNKRGSQIQCASSKQPIYEGSFRRELCNFPKLAVCRRSLQHGVCGQTKHRIISNKYET